MDLKRCLLRDNCADLWTESARTLVGKELECARLRWSSCSRQSPSYCTAIQRTLWLSVRHGACQTSRGSDMGRKVVFGDNNPVLPQKCVDCRCSDGFRVTSHIYFHGTLRSSPWFGVAQCAPENLQWKTRINVHP